jgi:hypothetical protein
VTEDQTHVEVLDLAHQWFPLFQDQKWEENLNHSQHQSLVAIQGLVAQEN